MVAAVAFSGVLTSTQTADAAERTPTVNAVPGETVTVVFAGTGGRFVISSDSEGTATFEITGGTASASFTANGGQTLVCANDAACDSAKDGADDGTSTTNPMDFDTGIIRVSLTIDEDSPNGFILITITDANPATGTGISKQRVDVSTTDRVVSLTAAGPSAAPAVAASGEAGVLITATLKNSVDGGVNGKAVIIYTTLGVLTGCGVAEGTIQACTESSADTDTDADVDTAEVPGTLQVTLVPTGRAGVATVNFTMGELTAAVDVIFYGPAASISAAADQSSIAIGGATFIVVTVLDSGDNPVVGHTIGTRSQGPAGGDADLDGVVGPAAKSVAVNVVDDRDKDADGDRTVDKGDLPACNNQLEADYATAGEEEDGPTNLQAGTPIADVGVGTNSSGQCVLHVMAPASPTNPALNATRGTNTVHIAGPGASATDTSKDAAVEIQVGGAPTTISTDAPEYVEPLSSTTVTISVVDDEDVPVGAVTATVDQVEGDGKVLDPEVTGTSDGVARFTYLAPSTPGTAVFRITAGSGAGTIASNVVLNIGSAPEEAPDAPPATWNDALVSGAQNVVWNGDDGADVADGSAEGVTAIWQWNGTGWDGYFPAAADVPGGNTLSSLTNGAAYWVIVE